MWKNQTVSWAQFKTSIEDSGIKDADILEVLEMAGKGTRDVIIEVQRSKVNIRLRISLSVIEWQEPKS